MITRMSRVPLGIIAGVLLAGLMGLSIFFVPEEPLKGPIYLATSIKGGLLGLMLATALSKKTRWSATLIAGAALGGLMGLVIALAKGFESAPLVIPISLVQGMLLAAILKVIGVDEPR